MLDSKPPVIYVRRPYSSDVDAEAMSMLEEKLDADYVLTYVRRGDRQFHDVYEARPER